MKINLIAVLALTALGLTACVGNDPDGGVSAVSVTVHPGGERCLISNHELTCREVPACIRDVAKIASDARVVVTGDPHKTSERHFAAVIEDIKSSGYTFVYGSFEVGAH